MAARTSILYCHLIVDGLVSSKKFGLGSTLQVESIEMIAYDQTYKDAQIYLDGNSFYRCRFERCTIVINGLMGCVLDDPRFVDCHWTVNGPAQNTLQLLSALYKAGATELVESTFKQIRGQ